MNRDESEYIRIEAESDISRIWIRTLFESTSDSLSSPHGVISLAEKLQEKELHIQGPQLSDRGREEPNRDHSYPPTVPSPVLHLQRGEDRLSTRSGESAILDGEAGALPADSCGESYFQERLIEATAGCCIGPVLKGGLGSEQDGGISDESCSYLPGAGIFEEADHEDNWWVWS